MSLVRWIFLIVLIAALWTSVEWGSVGSSLRGIDLVLVALVLALELGFYVIESWRIKVFGRGRYTYATVFRSRLLSVFLGLILPGLATAEVVRVFLMDADRPGNKVFTGLILIANRVYGFLSLALFVAVAFLMFPEHVPSWAETWRELIIVGGLVVGVLPATFGIGATRRLSAALVRRVTGVARKTGRKVHLALQGTTLPSAWCAGITSSLVTSMMAVIQFWLVAKAVGLDTTLLVWTIWMPVIAFSAFLPIGFGAVGSQEAGFALMSHALGIPLDALLAASIIIHAIRIVGSLPGALFLRDIRDLSKSGGFLELRALLRGAKSRRIAA